MCKDLCFEVTKNGINLHINDQVIIPFSTVNEMEQFAKDILGMLPEVRDSVEDNQ
jgi:hypothetical protein